MADQGLPPLYEDAVHCFCGHGLFDHDEYGPCEKCPNGGCRAWVGCLVVGRPKAGDPK